MKEITGKAAYLESTKRFFSIDTCQSLAERVRAALAQIPRVVERKMFGGITFMVREKMCISQELSG